MRTQGRQTLSVRLSVALALCAALPAHACWEDAATRYSTHVMRLP